MRYWKKRRNIMAFNRFNPPRRGLVEVPNLRGLTLNLATTELDMRGLMVATGEELPEHDHPPWAPTDLPHVVVDQIPPARMAVPSGSTVRIWEGHIWSW